MNTEQDGTPQMFAASQPSNSPDPQGSQLFNGVEVVDTFAEAFSIKGTRVIITAATQHWARVAGAEMCGNATSVIACDLEAAIERELSPEETPDGRPGVSVLAFAFSREGLVKAIQRRVGQCVLTCATTACYNGLPDADKDKFIPLGNSLRYFGDGFQISKQIGSRRYWRIPVMDGEFLCEDQLGTVNAIAGGNLILCGESPESALLAAESAVAAMRKIPDVIMPFPGGIVRSGSKVGAKYPGMKASTNDPFCPTLKNLTATELPESCMAAYEIVIDGFTEDAIKAAMKAGLNAAVQTPGLLRVSAGNYGGKLGKYHFYLHQLL